MKASSIGITLAAASIFVIGTLGITRPGTKPELHTSGERFTATIAGSPPPGQEAYGNAKMFKRSPTG